MKNTITCLVMLIMLMNSAFSQLSNNLIFFTEQGEKFSVVLNGILQNSTPEANIKITNIIASNYKLKIIFEDVKLGEIDKNLVFNQKTETTYNIKKNNKGEYVIRWMNEVSIEQTPPPTPNQSTIVFTTIMPVASTTTTVTQSQTTTTISNVNTNPAGVNMNTNINANETNTNSSITSYTTTTTEITNPIPVNVLHGYSGAIGCPYPMSAQDFVNVINSISSKSFEDSKLSVAKQVIGTNCIFSSQVKEIIMLFSFEDTRLDFAKYAYEYTYDIGNYYQVNDAFKFETSIDDLNTYIQKFKK